MLNFWEWLIQMFVKPPKEEEKIVPKTEDDSIDLQVLVVDDITKIKMLYPKIQKIAYKFLSEAINSGLRVGVFQSYRTLEEQAKLYAQGRDALGNIVDPKKIVTYTKPGYGYHNYGLAFDIVFKNDKGWTWDLSNDWEKLGNIGERYGFEWGGRWKQIVDKPHFQMTFKQPATKLLDIYNKNKSMQEVWDYLDVC